MIYLLQILIALPCFSSVLPSQGAQTIYYSREVDSGYLSVSTVVDSWGGMPHVLLSGIDQYGMIIWQKLSSFTGELLSVEDCQDGIVILSTEAVDDITQVAFIEPDGTERWLVPFTQEFTPSGDLCSIDSSIYISGNGEDCLKVACIDSQGILVWSKNYPDIDFQIKDMCIFENTIYILGIQEQAGWFCNPCIFQTDIYGVQPLMKTITLPTGRNNPEALWVDTRGIFLLVNALNEFNGMVYETQLVKLSIDGGVQWIQSLTGTSWIRATDMVSLPNGEFVLCGWTNSLPLSESNRSDLFICCFSNSGDLLWQREYGSSAPDYALDISSVSDGGLIVSGCTTENLYQGWLLKTDSLGFLEPQGVSQFETEVFSVQSLVNPVSKSFLPLLVSSGRYRILDISVIDLAGRVVQRSTAAVTQGSNTVNLSISLPAGLYSVRVSSDSEECLTRVIVWGGSR